jgi:hypothetical protein
MASTGPSQWRGQARTRGGHRTWRVHGGVVTNGGSGDMV